MKNWFTLKWVQFGTWYNTPRVYTNGDMVEVLIFGLIAITALSIK